jgi:hypothetical protein
MFVGAFGQMAVPYALMQLCIVANVCVCVRACVRVRSQVEQLVGSTSAVAYTSRPNEQCLACMCPYWANGCACIIAYELAYSQSCAPPCNNWHQQVEQAGGDGRLAAPAACGGREVQFAQCFCGKVDCRRPHAP